MVDTLRPLLCSLDGSPHSVSMHILSLPSTASVYHNLRTHTQTKLKDRVKPYSYSRLSVVDCKKSETEILKKKHKQGAYQTASLRPENIRIHLHPHHFLLFSQASMILFLGFRVR